MPIIASYQHWLGSLAYLPQLDLNLNFKLLDDENQFQPVNRLVIGTEINKLV
jgi:hypothetical protein